MSSPAGGNPNQAQPPFELRNLFKPPPNSNPNISSQYPSPSLPITNPNPNFSYPPSTPPLNFHHPFLHYPQSPIPNPNTNPNPNHGARLMALLNTNPPPHLESSTSMPAATIEGPRPILTIPSAPPANMARGATAKVPRGRLLGGGERAVYDVDLRVGGETNAPQLEVTPITKYVSDPGLVLGRQIAVNRTYISYGLKQGAIRILNINTALRSLLRGHSQKVTDMAFFADDVHLLASASVDGKVVVWKIDEGPDEENTPQITGRSVISVQLGAEGESYHPRICWHSHKQEVLIVAIGENVLKFDTTKLGRNKEFSETEPLKCTMDKLIDGIQLIGKHEGDITDLSISQWMTTRIASASKDGMVKIWDDRRSVPLVTLRPHEGLPVSSVAFLTSPHRPDHIVLVTGGPLNREVKMWASASEEGWLFPSETEIWKCTQTLELRSSSELKHEEAFFNQVVVLPRASLVLLANAKKNAIYAVHVDYGSCPSSTRMDYVADFTVTMPILSLTGTSDNFPDGEQIVQVYCVQTQAIQQYALDLYQCLPPQVDTGLPGSAPRPEGVNILELPRTSSKSSLYGNGFEAVAPATMYSVAPPSSEITSCLEHAKSNADKPSTPPLSMPEQIPAASERATSQQVEMKVDDVIRTGPDASDSSEKDENKAGARGNDYVPTSNVTCNLGGGNATHLVTPSEILSGALSSSESSIVSQCLNDEEVKAQDNENNNSSHNNKVDVQYGDNNKDHLGYRKDFGMEHADKSLSSPTPDSDSEMVKEIGSAAPETVTEAPRRNTVSTPDTLDNPPHLVGSQVQENTRDSSDNALAPGGPAVESASGATGKNQKQGQLLDSSIPSSSADPLNEPMSCTDFPSNGQTFSLIQSMQDTLNQLVSMHKEIQKQMNSVVSGPVNKEGKRVELALGRSMEKSVKTNNDAIWARFQEELAKRDKAEKERVQQITNLVTNYMNKDLPTMLEKTIKKEIPTVGSILTRAVTPVIEKCIASTVADSFQRGVGDKAVNQLDKSVNSKLETTVARQIQAQFQTTGKQALQETLKSSLESSVIPAFEQSCKAMFDQVDATFQKGMSEHTAAAQQQFDSTHSALAITLRDAINSASSVTKNLSSELVDGQRKILSIVSGNTNALNPLGMHKNNGSMAGLPDMPLSLQQIEAPLDPTKELSALISEHKFLEAFTKALQRSDVSIVSWLCSQVDLHAICSMVPLPLSQGVLLALLQQLSCDLGSETARKLGWMTDVAIAINPTDPLIAMHVRPIFEQVYNLLAHQRSLPTTTTSDSASIRLVMHVINSVLASCK